MNTLAKIRPPQPLKYLKWFDIVVVTALLFGQFIYRSTELYLASLSPSATATAADTTNKTVNDGAAYSSNLELQLLMLALTVVYLLFRRFDFKQLPIRLSWSVLFWVPFIFAVMGILSDTVTTLSGEYNYFDPSLFKYINPIEALNKFLALSPFAIGYAFLNGFYEEFFFLGLITSVKEENKWYALIFSTLVRISFHTYQGIIWAIAIGVIFGLFYYFMYKNVVKNLLPFFLMHAQGLYTY